MEAEGQMSELESAIQKKILHWLGYRGIFAWTNKSQGTFDPKRGAFRRTNQLKGVPDILGVLPDGRFLGIEVKRKENKPSPEQLDFIAKANQSGAFCFVAYSVEDVSNRLEPKVIAPKRPNRPKVADSGNAPRP